MGWMGWLMQWIWPWVAFLSDCLFESNEGKEWRGMSWYWGDGSNGWWGKINEFELSFTLFLLIHKEEKKSLLAVSAHHPSTNNTWFQIVGYNKDKKNASTPLDWIYRTDTSISFAAIHPSKLHMIGFPFIHLYERYASREAHRSNRPRCPPPHRTHTCKCSTLRASHCSNRSRFRGMAYTPISININPSIHRNSHRRFAYFVPSLIQHTALLLLPTKQRFIAEIGRVHFLVRHSGICARCAQTSFRNRWFIDARKADSIEINRGNDVPNDGWIVFLQGNGLKADFLGWFGCALAAEVKGGLLFDVGGFNEMRRRSSGEMRRVGWVEFAEFDCVDGIVYGGFKATAFR